MRHKPGVHVSLPLDANPDTQLTHGPSLVASTGPKWKHYTGVPEVRGLCLYWRLQPSTQNSKSKICRCPRVYILQLQSYPD